MQQHAHARIGKWRSKCPAILESGPRTGTDEVGRRSTSSHASRNSVCRRLAGGAKGFELSRSLQRNGRCRRGARAVSKASSIPRGDRGFESPSLQRGVSNELCVFGRASSTGGRAVRIRLPPPASLSHQCLPCLPPQRPGFCRECEPGRDQRTGRAGPEPARLGCFSLTGIAAVPPSGNQSAATRRAQALAWAPSVAGRSSARQEAALIGPIERQIEFGKARRRELDGLPAV